MYNIDQKLLADKISLESKWTQEYLEYGYTVGLTEIEKEIKEIRKKNDFFFSQRG